jgi:fibronectin type 3 domain-containing protein
MILCAPDALWAQSAGTIQAKGGVVNGEIRLRWAPDNSAVWQLANQYGYTVERITLMENGKLVRNPSRQVLATGLKPALLVDWEPFSEDDYVAVAAQAIHGESFETDAGNTSEIARVINASRELENRFSFALYAADLSPKAAELSGLSFRDEQVLYDQKYVYKIYADVPLALSRIDTASVFIGLADAKPLPPPFDPQIELNDRVAMISWNGEVHRNVYNTYIIERSEDGVRFESISRAPIVNTFPEESVERLFKGDSLPANEVTYYYRIIGIDAFGQRGPASDTLTGKGLPAFHIAPNITHHEILPDGSVYLLWTVPKTGLDLLKKFSLSRRNEEDRTLERIIESIPAGSREVIDRQPHSSNYYVVTAHDTYGREITSFPYFVQLEDSIPPGPPVGLEGEILPSGLVSLRWTPNVEPDVLGYKLYKSNHNNDGFIELPGAMVSRAEGIDSIALNNLTERIYYKVRAFDRRYNPSDFSEVLELKKPDLIPPVAPVFRAIENDSLGILLQWELSPSEDAVMNLLYRRSIDETDWTLILTDEGKTDHYLDQEVKHRVLYAYTLVAVDDDGLESRPTSPVTMKRISPNPYPPIQDLSYIILEDEVKISWTYGQRDVVKYAVYKATNGQPLQLYKELEAKATNELVDPVKSKAPASEYVVQGIFATGERTPFSKKIKVGI